MFVVRRSNHNPILAPDRSRPAEAVAVFNWCPVKRGRLIHVLYRAVAAQNSLGQPGFSLSTIAQATTTDGYHFERRGSFIVPDADFDRFGCEDPRITFFEGTFYTFYTALSRFPFEAAGIKVAVALSRDLITVTEKHLVTPFNAKAMALFPERIDGKLAAILTAHTDEPPAAIAIAYFDRPEELWSETKWRKWHDELDLHKIDDPRRLPSDHVEIGAPPVKTKHGWLVIYSHIQNYFGGGPRIFGVEALLLDLKDPRRIIGRTKGPILVPEELYELGGQVPAVVFPSGCLVENGVLKIYYGAADTTGCVAEVSLDDLIESIFPETAVSRRFARFAGNPILTPNSSHPWEARSVFNPAAIELGGRIHLLYRALSDDFTSRLGYAATRDGFTIEERLPEPVYSPREPFEEKKVTGNSGCEDPRLSKIGSMIYMCYTAFDGVGPPRVALTAITEKDFLARRWRWRQPVIITPPNIDDKDACILPEKVGEKYMIIHRIGADICADFVDSLDLRKLQVRKCIKVLGPRPLMWDGRKVGITAPPAKTKHGWLLLYHAVSAEHHRYRIGAVLLDLKDPTVVLARSTDPIFEPEALYEKEGLVKDVVFPCGMIIRDEKVFIYYGGADSVVGVATMEFEDIIGPLVRGCNPAKY